MPERSPRLDTCWRRHANDRSSGRQLLALVEAAIELSVLEQGVIAPDFSPSPLVNVLDILLDNAIRFTPAGRGNVSVNASSGELHFPVHDTGIGIACEQQAGILDKFSQADDSPSQTHGGAGLGLASAHRLAVPMGGTISVESAPGQGAAFRVTLPLLLEK